MRMITCDCGEVVASPDDAVLARALRAHYGLAHRFRLITNSHIRALIAEQARDASPPTRPVTFVPFRWPPTSARP